MRAFSVFANEESDSVTVNFSEDFLSCSDGSKLDILFDAVHQVQCIKDRLIRRLEKEQSC
jgi:hypothetical protein